MMGIRGLFAVRSLLLAAALAALVSLTWAIPAGAHLSEGTAGGTLGQIDAQMLPLGGFANGGGWEIRCRAAIENDGADNVSSRLMCYEDAPIVAVNPIDAGTGSCVAPIAPSFAIGVNCGDGLLGSPPPNSWVTPQTVSNITDPSDGYSKDVAGTYNDLGVQGDPSDDTVTMDGCFSGNPDFAALSTWGPHIYWRITLGPPIVAHGAGNQTGTIDKFIQRPTCAAPAPTDQPGSTGFPGWDDAPLVLSEDAHTPTAFDKDGDGCPDTSELNNDWNAATPTAQMSGGNRDPWNAYDYYDVNHDGVVDLFNDILGVIQKYQAPENVAHINAVGIDDATNATPIVITTAANHGYSNGDKVRVKGVEGNTAANGPTYNFSWTITKIDATSFSLDGSSGNGAYQASTIDNASKVVPSGIDRYSSQYVAAVGDSGDYHPAYDRGPTVGGGKGWDKQPPDGVIDLFNDILGVISSYQNNCP